MLLFHECAANMNDVLRRYGGHVVAKLPFEPFSLLAKLAHRGITTPSANDCSVVRTSPLSSILPDKAPQHPLTC